MLSSPWHYFTDSILRAPTIACMLMCAASSLVGTLTFIRKRSLIGESLAHASYPGAILGALLAWGGFSMRQGEGFSLLVLLGAFLSALLGLYCIDRLEKCLKVSSDAALCFVLSAFFGVGLTVASYIQFSHTLLYQKVQVYFYGQAATMTDVHIFVYGALFLLVAGIIWAFYKEIQASSFDRGFAESIGLRMRLTDSLILLLVALAVVIGMRSVGFVLISAMLIAPAAAARQFTHHLSHMLILSVVFGGFSGFLGNYLSVELTKGSSDLSFALPTGPMIVLIASLFCLLALFLAPERGVCARYIRRFTFRYRCIQENILKSVWRAQSSSPTPYKELRSYECGASLVMRGALRALCKEGWLVQSSGGYLLTRDGERRAARIVRLHRLWELYLAKCLGMGLERVHRSADEMEHVITPDLEKELTQLLDDPKEDPHHQPIPPSEV